MLHLCKVKDVSIIGELKNLQVLSFVGSDIEELPMEIGQLANLKLLDLTKCEKLILVPSGVIRGLSRLEGLYMRNFKQWKDGRT